MNTAPSGQGRAVVATGLPEVHAVAASVAAEWPLVGRAEELDYIGKILRADRSAGVLISGAAGVGKTRLARELEVRAATNGWAVEWIRASEATREISFGAVARWIEPSTVGSLRRSERLAQLEEHLRSRARSQPVLLTVDDAHLLDSATASLLQQVATETNVRVVLTVRDASVAPDAVRAVWADARMRRIQLQPLALEQIDELLSTALGGRIDHPSRAELWRLCVGNVMLLRELVLAGLSSGDLAVLHGVWHWSAQAPVTASIRELVRSRIASLSPTQRETIETVAVGDPMPEVLVTGTAYEQDALALERAGLVQLVADPVGPLLQLSHPLFAEAVRELMPTLAARRARRSLAAAILSLPEPPPGSELRAAVWLLDAGITPEAQILEAAARQAGRLSAVQLQERIARAGRDAHGGYAFSVVLAGALVVQAKWAETIRLCTSPPLSEADTTERRCEVAVLHAQALAWGPGRLTEALELLARVTTGSQGAVGSHCAALRGAIAMFSGDLEQAVTACEQVLLEPDLPDELVVRGLNCVVPALVMLGRAGTALARSERGQELLDSGAFVLPAWRAELRYGHVSALRFGGRYADALQMAQAFYDASGATSRSAAALAAFALGQAQLDVGHLARAEATLREAVALFRQEDATGVLPWCLCALAQTLALSGHAGSALELLDLPDAEMAVAPVFGPEMERARAWVVFAGGELSRGVELAAQAARHAKQLGQVAVAARAWHDVARMGDPPPAAIALAGLSPRDESDETALFRDHAVALVAEDAPALDDVYERFHHRGALLRAAETAAAAVAIYLAAGHRAPAERARRNVDECIAACDGATTPALRQVRTVDPLSFRESEVAALAASGLANVQIAEKLSVSVRTIEGHLQHAYAKLEIHHRSELPGGGALPEPRHDAPTGRGW